MTPQQIIAATLRQLGSWGPWEIEPGQLERLAEEVEAYDHGTGGLAALSCPMCQEIECDAGCPLGEVRRP